MSHQIVECTGCLTKLRVIEIPVKITYTLRSLEEIQQEKDLAEANRKKQENHMSNSNGFVRKSATEVFCSWATAEHLPELRKVLADSDGLMFDARKRAFQTIAKVGTAEDYPVLIGLVTDSFLRHDVKTFLIGIGSPIEDPILKKIDSITDAGARNELIEVLKNVGTKKSIETLEKLAKEGSSKHNAIPALDAIRARE